VGDPPPATVGPEMVAAPELSRLADAPIAGALTPITPASTAVSPAITAEFCMVAVVFMSVEILIGSCGFPPNMPLKKPATPPWPSEPYISGWMALAIIPPNPSVTGFSTASRTVSRSWLPNSVGRVKSVCRRLADSCLRVSACRCSSSAILIRISSSFCIASWRYLTMSPVNASSCWSADSRIDATVCAVSISSPFPRI